MSEESTEEMLQQQADRAELAFIQADERLAEANCDWDRARRKMLDKKAALLKHRLQQY